MTENLCIHSNLINFEIIFIFLFKNIFLKDILYLMKSFRESNENQKIMRLVAID